jgi:hypothetical protein
MSKIVFIEECGSKKGRFLCHCGKEWISTISRVKNNEIKSCGCLSNPCLIGKKFNRLKVIEKSEKRYKNGDVLWKCVCDCGNYSFATAGQLKSKTGTKSCGCLNMEMRKSRKGKDHPRWNTNLTDKDREEKRKTQEHRKWSKDIFERDNYTCVICGQYGKRLNAHHLDGFHWHEEGRLSINNGITLCKYCHDDFHLIYGKKNNTKEQFFEYWEEEINEQI